ncbi:hypothetical protein BDN71DRAFT_663843 [Pleurotus eryngii]|uniref:Uncharacterized protein n=1 Tax=Pleurotus eryngii TaxID=5323 RepID=A0A9P6D940_PLEER|nr:hypothetical protein BDN71DRAFT_663843 [Pleurotus eryngii]
MEEEEAEDADRRQRQEELGRPRTPRLPSLGVGVDLFTDAKHPPQYAQSAELLDALNSRLLLLSNQFESFITLTTSLQAQHDAAQSTILNLQAKVVELEDRVKTVGSGVACARSDLWSGPGWPRRARNGRGKQNRST